MILKLERKYKKPAYTIGNMYINGVFLCNTLEDTVRDVKIKGKTAIPYGIYKVILSLSRRFKRVLPEILNVPEFAGVRIHAGNTAADTEGCILVGRNAVRGALVDSRIHLDRLLSIMREQKDISIEITRFYD